MNYSTGEVGADRGVLEDHLPRKIKECCCR